MTSGPHDLQVEVVDEQIIVALIGTAYGVVYYKRDSDPQLYAKEYPIQVDLRSEIVASRVSCQGLEAGQRQSARTRMDRVEILALTL
jgi:hypothetical protein